MKVGSEDRDLLSCVSDIFPLFPSQYIDKEEVVLWMNTVGPYHNRQETYKYFSLPFCAGSKKTISHYHETLGEALQGVELEFSGLDIKFKGDLQLHINLLSLLGQWEHSDYTFPLVYSSVYSYSTADFLTNVWSLTLCRWGHADNILWNWLGQTQTGCLCLCHQESLLVPNVHRWPSHLG